MEITIERFEQEISGLKEGLRRLDHEIEREIAGVKEDLGQKIANAQVKITQWVVGLFVGTAVIMATLIGVYINAILLMR